MFDKKVDIISVYGEKPVWELKRERPPKRYTRNTSNISKRKTKFTRSSTLIWREYQELKKTSIFKKWWKKQFAQQHALCYYCKKDLHNCRVNVEHIIPMSKGGTNKYKNMVLSCADCNKKKGSMMLPKKERIRLRKELSRQIEEDTSKFRAQKKKDEEILSYLRSIF